MSVWRENVHSVESSHLKKQYQRSVRLNELVTYKYWGLDLHKKIRKLHNTVDVSVLISEFCEAIKTYSLHSFTDSDSRQRSQYKSLKRNIPQGST